MDAQSPPVRVLVAVALRGIRAALLIPNSTALRQYCSKLDQANSHVETCTDLASMLIEHGRTALDVFRGGRFVAAIGRNDPRLAALRDQADAIKWQWSQRSKSAEEDSRKWFSCDGLQRLRRNAEAEARLGEAGLLRRDLADAGITVSQAAERWRAQVHGQSSKAE